MVQMEGSISSLHLREVFAFFRSLKKLHTYFHEMLTNLTLIKNEYNERRHAILKIRY